MKKLESNNKILYYLFFCSFSNLIKSLSHIVTKIYPKLVIFSLRLIVLLYKSPCVFFSNEL
jgi:hypothetical protein